MVVEVNRQKAVRYMSLLW